MKKLFYLHSINVLQERIAKDHIKITKLFGNIRSLEGVGAIGVLFALRALQPVDVCQVKGVDWEILPAKRKDSIF
jgi:hypothetical protein